MTKSKSYLGHFIEGICYSHKQNPYTVSCPNPGCSTKIEMTIRVWVWELSRSWYRSEKEEPNTLQNPIALQEKRFSVASIHFC
jgi:hypothetical protein